MGRSCFLKLLLVLALLAVSFSHGFGRKMMQTVEVGDSYVQAEEIAGTSREMIELLDYQLEPRANNNTKNGQYPPPQGR